MSSNKFWFLSVMARRSALMLTYEDVPLISAEPSISNRIEITSSSEPAWSAAPSDLLAMNTAKTQSLSLKEDVLQIAGDQGSPDKFKSPPVGVQTKSDYVLRVPVRAQQGRMVIKVVRVDTGRIVASATVPDSLEPGATTTGSLTFAQLPFVNNNANQIAIVVEDTERAPTTSGISVGRMELFRLGPAAYLWTKYPRIFVKSIQKFFTTRWMLPLALLGVALLAVARRGKVLAVILAIPLYYLCTHSPLHLELRYALALHYFWAMLVPDERMPSDLWRLKRKSKSHVSSGRPTPPAPSTAVNTNSPRANSLTPSNTIATPNTRRGCPRSWASMISRTRVCWKLAAGWGLIFCSLRVVARKSLASI
jgi:hypothetical protein